MKLAFWGSLFLIVYTFILYPLLLFILRPMKKSKTMSPSDPCIPYEPQVSFIIAAHNEEAVIKTKLLNTMHLSFPTNKFQIIVTSDNSTDSTNNIVQSFPMPNLLLMDLQQRGGKTRAQNQAVKKATGEILVFSDANSIWKQDAVQQLIKRFADQKVGYVCGQLKYVNTDNYTEYSEGLYWKYEMQLRYLESSLLSVTAGNGAIYAIRTADYTDVADLYSHDFEMPHLMVAKGKQAVYEPAAIAYEKAGADTSEEYRRKVRMLARTWHRIIKGPCLYNPVKYGCMYAWMMISHRLFRYLVPFGQIILFISNCFLWSHGLIYQIALLTQAFFYCLAVLGGLLRLKAKLFYLPYYFMMFQFTVLVGFFKALTGNVSGTWEKAESTRQ